MRPRRAGYNQEILDAFNDEVMHKGIRDLRISASIASFAFLLFNILDHAVFPELARLFLSIRLFVLVANGLIALLTFLPNAFRIARLLKMAAYMVYSGSIIVMVYLTGGYESLYYAGLNIVLIGFMFLLPLDGFRSIIVCLIIYAGYITPALLTQEISNWSILLNNNFFIVTTMILSVASSYLSDQMHLKEFAARHHLATANEELKNLDRLKTQFFANVSHEVRTPLTSIIAPLQSLRQGDVGTLNIDQNELLDQMHRNAIRLLDLINQMLDFSKLEAGKASLRLSSVDMVAATEEIVALFKEVTARKKLQLIFEHGPDSEQPIYIDRDRYERILTNLVRNAIKFTEHGGITVSLRRTSDSMIATVSDTGIGIAESHLPNIFKRFEQVDSTSTRSYEGTGLGLAIVEESVRLMHGEIRVESVLDVGTVFAVEIPADLKELEPGAFVERRKMDRRRESADWSTDDRRNQERRRTDYSRIPVSELVGVDAESYRESDPAEGEITTVGGARILIAEDNEDLRHYIKKILRNMGHNIVTAENGAVAYEKLMADDAIDVLVSDIMMPKMDGYALLSSVREHERIADLPIILITAKAGDDPKLKALGIGADDYLPKPINVRELDARIRNLISSRDLRRASAEASALDRRIDELRMSFAQTLAIRDAETGDHSRNVLDIGTRIAEKLGLDLNQTLKDSLLLHDIGKIGIPDKILLKPSRLDDAETEIMQSHAALGKELLESFSNFQDVSEIIHAHQEHWDGTGYPRGLVGEEIPLIARIIGVADAYHAMTSTRPYRKALSRDKAIAELIKHRGTQFDPDVVDAFLSSLN